MMVAVGMNLLFTDCHHGEARASWQQSSKLRMPGIYHVVSRLFRRLWLDRESLTLSD